MAEERVLDIKLTLYTDSDTNWAASQKIITKGVPCVEFTADGKTKLKVGDGRKIFSALPYVGDVNAETLSEVITKETITEIFTPEIMNELLTKAMITAALGYTPLDEDKFKTDYTDKVGVAGGLATLDNAGQVPASQLPSYVDDVIEVDNAAALENIETPEKGKIYVTIDDGKTYRYSGSGFVEISKSIVVTASTKNGYINAGGVDIKVVDIDSELSETSENPVENKAIYAKVNSIESDISTINTTLGDIDNTLDNIDGNIESLQAKDAEIDGEITNLKAKDISLDGEITNLKAKDIEIDAAISALQAKDVELVAANAAIVAAMADKIDKTDRLVLNCVLDWAED